MTDTQRPDGDDDLSDSPEYEQLGEQGNPFSGDGGSESEDADVDRVPSGQESGESTDAANPPLPDWGPTDGEHGVDGDATTS